MSRDLFIDSCRAIALRLGRRSNNYGLYMYEDASIRIFCSAHGDVAITVGQPYAIKSKTSVTTINGRIRFYKGWQRHVEHVSRLTILDQLAQASADL